MDTGEPIIRSECVKAFVGQLLTDVRQVQLEGSQDAEWQLMLPDGTARLFARVWIQGVVVDLMGDVGVTIDDGSGKIFVHLRSFMKRYGIDEPIQQGAYLMVHGPLKTDGDGAIIVKASKVKNYSQQPEMEASWYLHVMRLHSEVYPTPPAARPHEDTTMHAWHGADDHDEGYESPELV